MDWRRCRYQESRSLAAGSHWAPGRNCEKIPLFIGHGNRDFLMGPDLARLLGATLLPDSACFTPMRAYPYQPWRRTLHSRRVLPAFP
ncbi:UDP-2,3-diacylglucosamine hydrolase [Advenella kashmirensis WT001]|uniref:UDP-2,3-diacylglucosamine hydrolase n=1 Tax=Advenella kashmirensis (strain DSM 17095 / LMG 22695 / WT001) TaxID=1036672 RepID=I3UE88_ADVKW|nr:UDP-2,3-diacylglucosamine hydrolase [Advenella kashmirensis WT001]